MKRWKKMSRTFTSDELREIFGLKKRKKRQFYWNMSIQSTDKDNGINRERRKFSPTIFHITSEKRIGIQKKIVHFDDDADFNEWNN